MAELQGPIVDGIDQIAGYNEQDFIKDVAYEQTID